MKLAKRSLLTLPEAARLARITPRTLNRYRAAGNGPQAIRFGVRCIRFRLGDVLDWISACAEKAPVIVDGSSTISPVLATELLAATSDVELDQAFDRVFSLVQDAREGGDLSDCDALLRWLVEPNVVSAMHVETLLCCLRLTYDLRELLQTWRLAVEVVSQELTGRGEDVRALLCGLVIREGGA